MIGGGGDGGIVGKGAGGGIDLGGKPVGQDGIIRPPEDSPKPPREGSRDVHEGIIISEPYDWCKKPDGTLIPFTIWAVQTDSANLANSVTQTGDRSHAKESLILHCHGDEKGWPNGGVNSHTVCAECTPKTWSETVFAEGRNMVRHDDEWWMNHRNTWGRLYYVKEPAPYTTPQVDRVEPKIWLAQEGARSEMGTGRGAERESLIPPPRGMESWDWNPPRPSYQPYDPSIEPNEPANNNVPATPTLVDPRPQPEPLAGPRPLFAPDPTKAPLPFLRSNKLTVRRRRRNPCKVGRYGTLQCDKEIGEQKHHIVPEYTLKYDGDNRIPNMLSNSQGAAICLIGYGGDTEHGLAQSETKYDIASLGLRPEEQFGKYRYPKGTAPIGDINNAAITAASRIVPECESKIRKEVEDARKEGNVGYDQLGRTTWSPSKGDALKALKSGAINNGVTLWDKPK